MIYSFYSSRLIITRPVENISSLPSNAILLPLQAYETIPYNLDHLGSYIITSQNSARLAIKETLPKDAAYYCVGRTTKNILVQNGYRFVFSPHYENAQNLRNFIEQNHNHNVKLCYLSGEIIKHPLDLELQATGFSVVRKIVYRTIPLDPDLNLIHKNDSIIFYSKHTYDLFMKHAHKIKDILATCQAIFTFEIPKDSFFWANKSTLKKSVS